MPNITQKQAELLSLINMPGITKYVTAIEGVDTMPALILEPLYSGVQVYGSGAQFDNTHAFKLIVCTTKANHSNNLTLARSYAADTLMAAVDALKGLIKTDTQAEHFSPEVNNLPATACSITIRSIN